MTEKNTPSNQFTDEYLAAVAEAEAERAAFNAAFTSVFGPDPALTDITDEGVQNLLDILEEQNPTPPADPHSYYPVVFHADGTVTVINKRYTDEWATKALNQANKACTLPGDSYSTVSGATYEEAVANAERWAAEAI